MNDTHTFSVVISKEELITMVRRNQEYWKMKRAIEKYLPGIIGDLDSYEEEPALGYIILNSEKFEMMFGDEPYDDLECLTAEQWVDKYWPIITIE